jgi:O-antigen/teichoic acid export membrane protein
VRATLNLLVLRGSGVVLSYVLLAVIGRFYGGEALGLYSFTTNAVNLAALVAALGFDGFLLQTAPERLQQPTFWRGIYRRTLPAALVAAALLALAATQLDNPSTRRATLVAALFVPLVVGHTLWVEALAAQRRRTLSEWLRSVLRPLLIIAALFAILAAGLQTTPYSPLWVVAAATLIVAELAASAAKPKPTANPATKPGATDPNAYRGHLNFMVLTVAGYLLANAASLLQEQTSGTEAVGQFNLAVRLSALSAFGLLVAQTVWGPDIAQGRNPRKAARNASLFAAAAALAAASVLWLSRGYLPQLFGVHLDDALLGPILIGQVAYALSAGPFIALTMGGSSRTAAVAIAAVAITQLAALSLNTPPALAHGASFALLAASYAVFGIRKIATFTP